MRLFSYKLKTDSGFAPNPFFGKLTLATCKPGIRKTKDIKNWIAGFTSKALNGDEVGKERLIFLMQVTATIPQFEYYNHPDFKNKIPNLSKKEFVYRAGDNIYKPIRRYPKGFRDFEQIRNDNHWDPDKKSEDINQKEHDLSGEKVLISENYYYFGKCAITIPKKIRPTVPRGVSKSGGLTHNLDQAKKFIDYIINNCKKGIHCSPHKWPSNDSSWSR